MGIDKARGSRKNTHRKNPASKDAYLRLLVKLYSFLSRRVEDAPFNKVRARSRSLSLAFLSLLPPSVSPEWTYMRRVGWSSGRGGWAEGGDEHEKEEQ